MQREVGYAPDKYGLRDVQKNIKKSPARRKALREIELTTDIHGRKKKEGRMRGEGAQVKCAPDKQKIKEGLTG